MGLGVGLVIDTLGGLLGDGGLFSGGKQIYGADFPNRKRQFQTWLRQANFDGQNQKYIDLNYITQNLLFEDSGWQADVQNYLWQTQRYMRNTPPFVKRGEKNFMSIIKPRIDRLNNMGTGSLTNGNGTGGSTGGSSGGSSKVNNASIFGGSNTLPILAGVGLLFYFMNQK